MFTNSVNLKKQFKNMDNCFFLTAIFDAFLLFDFKIVVFLTSAQSDTFPHEKAVRREAEFE